MVFNDYRSGQQSQGCHRAELAKTHLCSLQLQPSDNTVDLVAGAFAFCKAKQNAKAPAIKSTAYAETTCSNKASVLCGRQLC